MDPDRSGTPHVIRPGLRPPFTSVPAPDNTQIGTPRTRWSRGAVKVGSSDRPWFKWIGRALVEIGTNDHRGVSCVYVDSGSVHGSHSYFGARQDRSGHAKRKDGGDDDCSPDAHGFLHGECPGQRVSRQPRRYFHVTWSIVAFWLFHARLQSKFFLFPKLQSLRQLPLPLYGQDSLLRVRKD